MPTNVYDTTLLGQVDRRFLNSRHVRRGFAGIVVVVMAVLAVQFVHKSTTPTSGYRELLHAASPEPGDEAVQIERTRGAFGRWMYDIRQSRQFGKDPYRDFWFPTPPLVLAVLTPFAGAPTWLGASLWAVLKLAAVVAAVWLAFKAVSRSDRPLPFGVGVVAVLFGLRPLIGDIQHGNINILVLLPLCGTLYLWVRGRDVAAGMALGLAVALKLTPALLGVYYVYRRQWRVVAGMVIGLVVFGFAVPAVAFGPRQVVDHFRGWYGVMLEPVLVEGWATIEAKNQSLPGTVLRWLSGSGAIEVERIDQADALQYGSFGLARPVAAWAKWLSQALPFGVVAALAWLCRTRFSGRQDPRVGLEFALVLLAMLMLSERTWKHHCVTFVVVYAAVWYGLACFQWSVAFRGVFATGLGVQFVLLSLTGKDVIGKAAANALLYGGVAFVGMALCFVQAAWLLRRRWEPLVTGGAAAEP